MAHAKRYYWLKLKDDFFAQKEIKRLRKIAGGDTFTIIYLKLLLLSLQNEGKIYFDEIGDDFANELALELDEDEENVTVTLSFLQKKGLLEFVQDDEIFMSNIASMIGSETESARRVRKHRNALKSTVTEVISEHSNDEPLQSNNDVTSKKQVGNTEIEIDIEIEIEKELQQEDQKNGSTTTSDVHLFYQQNFGVEPPTILQDLDYWIQDLSAPVVIEALKRAIEAEKPYSYAKGIMKKWANKGIKTLDQVEQETTKWERQQGGGRELGNGPGIFGQSFSNDKDYKLTEEEIQELEKKKHLLL